MSGHRHAWTTRRVLGYTKNRKGRVKKAIIRYSCACGKSRVRKRVPFRGPFR